MLPLSTHRHPWPPAVKLSGAAAHGVNLPSQAGANGGRRALNFTILQRTRCGVCLREGFSRRRGKGGGRSTLPPRRDVGKGVLRIDPSLCSVAGRGAQFSCFGGRFIVCRALACHDCFYYKFESSMTQLVCDPSTQRETKNARAPAASGPAFESSSSLERHS